mmetsp:Transcript_21496/g.45206  ORF Transcript_21496/g.45206 Transcript_21496/m.45206 type:complete len:621 (+) Transcript_21496:300-2162(+)|eukprot:CAMPEP_0171333734 /NCGR_PEP_ID=MMETSP0878-20121228/4188_1 /TAXON_ID=67004 /ORGANISM="Thalassiosira weissflogii, Strain CCMP1336" /LENGTH=620 /DNA_ID=CAMNT_0011834711 /DNA_START=232 /DNA_END=2094 /DNA_ORIENTATION=-
MSGPPSNPLSSADYIGPKYEITNSVRTLHGITRFGRSSDITHLFSTDPDEQASYAAGLIVLLVFASTFFLFWGIALITFKCMGSGNGGFLSGSPFHVPVAIHDDREEGKWKRKWKRPLIARVVFILSGILLIVFSILLVAKGVTKLEDTATTAEDTFVALRKKIAEADEITDSIQEVGMRSVKIRDKVVDVFHTVMCDDPEVEEQLGINLVDVAIETRMALNALANFVYDYLLALRQGLAKAMSLTVGAETAFSEIQLVGWPVLVLAVALFILPAIFVIGTGFAMLDIKIKWFQLALSYFFLPVFVVVISLCIIGCCILLPVGVVNADVCTGGGNLLNGPDDTILTVYQNLLGMDSTLVFLLVAYYTQRCEADFYPYNFLNKYFDQLHEAQSALQKLIRVLQGNLDYIEERCGSDGFAPFLILAKSMKQNLDLLKFTVDEALMLVNCEDVNRMYVNAIHDAGCTKSPAAISWIFGSLMAISVFGLIMITLRASFLPNVYVKAPELRKEKKITASEDESVSKGQKNVDSQAHFAPSHNFDDDSVSDISDGETQMHDDKADMESSPVVIVRRYEGGVPSAPLSSSYHDDGMPSARVVRRFEPDVPTAPVVLFHHRADNAAEI